MNRSVSIRNLLVAALLIASVCFAGTQLEVTTQIKGILAKVNGGTGVSSTATFPTSGVVSTTLASGTATFATTSISSLACSATVSPTATGAANTDTVEWSYQAQPSATTDGRLTMQVWTGTNTVNFCRQNNTAASITPTAVVINWRIVK